MVEARALLYRFLSLLTSDPKNKSWSLWRAPDFLERVQSACRLLQGRNGYRSSSTEELAPGELPLSFLNSEPFQAWGMEYPLQDEFITLYDRLFGLVVSQECPPYEAEYYPQTFSVFRSQRMADVAGFYRAFGLEWGTSQPERPDHVSLELEFMGWLLAKEEYLSQGEADPEFAEALEIIRKAQRRFFQEHLVWWLPAFGRALQKKAEGLFDSEDAKKTPPQSFYGHVGALLCSFIGAERLFYHLGPPQELVPPPPESNLEKSPACDACPLT